MAEIIENRDRFAARFVLVSEIADANMGYVSAFRKNGFQCYFLENDYSYEGYLGALGGKESEFGRLKPLGNERERPPTADLVFVYDRAAKT